jgi:hypothetical protein
MLLTLPEKIQKGLNLPQIQYIYDSLPKSSVVGPWSKRTANSITEIVVHHSGDTGTIVNEAKYHINNRGWHTISYHVSIDRGGIFQLNDLLSVTSHAKGSNAYSIGVCINWNLTLRPPTAFEYNALMGVIMALKALFPNAKVSGHNEIGKRYGYGTACPVISMNELREDIMSAEQEMEHAEAPQKQDEIAYRMANHILYLQNMSRGKTSKGEAATPEQSKWALAQLLKMEPEFRRLGFLK